MPIVPKLTRQVPLEALPGARLTAAETPESQGAGIAEAQGQVANALAGVGAKTAAFGEQAYGEIVAKEKRRADNVALLSGDNRAGMKENELRARALTTRGQAAFGLPEQVMKDFNDEADKIEASMGTPEQKLAFRKIRSERAMSLDSSVRTHVYAEIQHYQGQELQSFLDNSQNAAVANATDPRAVGVELQRQVDAITTHAPDLGLGPEAIKQAIDATRSKTHVGVIENLLAQEQTKSAQIYFEEAKSQINGEQIARIEKALKEGSTRKEGQTQADAIVAAGGTLTEQREKARQIEDADVRDQVTTRIEHEWSIKEVQQRQNAEAALSSAYTLLDKVPDVSKIPPTAWVSFTGAERSGLRAYADRLSKGDPVETDWPTYYSLMGKAGTDPTSFATENLLGVRAKLGNGEFKQLTELQKDIRNNDRKAADQQLAGFRTHEQIVNNSLVQYGIDPNEPDKTKKAQQESAIAELLRMVDVQVQAQESLTGKKATNIDIQSVVDSILKTPATKKGSWWGLIPGNGVNFFDLPAGKRLIETKIDEVPALDRTQIEAALRRAGRPVTDVTVLDLYIQTQARVAK